MYIKYQDQCLDLVARARESSVPTTLIIRTRIYRAVVFLSQPFFKLLQCLISMRQPGLEVCQGLVHRDIGVTRCILFCHAPFPPGSLPRVRIWAPSLVRISSISQIHLIQSENAYRRLVAPERERSGPGGKSAPCRRISPLFEFVQHT